LVGLVERYVEIGQRNVLRVALGRGGGGGLGLAPAAKRGERKAALGFRARVAQTNLAGHADGMGEGIHGFGVSAGRLVPVAGELPEAAFEPPLTERASL
jgi:hypothetical protein